jgi:hypothetical protein
MNRVRYRAEIRRAKAMIELENGNPGRESYWKWYIVGINDVFRKSGENKELEFGKNCTPEIIEESRRGYRDGYHYGLITSKRGRSGIGMCKFPGIVVDEGTVAGFEELEALMNTKVSDLRRIAYVEYLVSQRKLLNKRLKKKEDRT